MAQSKIGWRPYVNLSITSSSLWNSIYSVYNADAIGSTSLNTSLVAAYNGESNTNDSKGTNNGTAVGGLTYTTGKIGDAFTFNGSNAYVELPNNSLNFTGDFSVSLWLYRQPLAGGMLVSNWYNGSTPYGWYIYNTNGVIKFLVGNGTSSPVCSFNSSVLTSNVWNFVTVTKTATSAKIYINGVLNTSATLSSSVVYTTTHYPMIGAAKYDTGLPNFLSQNGDKIDAVNVWNKELSASEVTELYNSGNGAQYITNDFYKPTTSDALNTYNGTAHGGLTYGLGKVGTAFVFNGTNAYVQLPNNSFNFTGDFSVSGWINQSSIKPYHMIIGNQAGVSGNFYGWLLWVFNNKLTLDLYNGNAGAASARWQPTTTLSTNTWIHFAITKKPGQAVKMYLNGVSVPISIIFGSNSGTVTYTPTNYSSIGANKYSSPIIVADAGYWNGSMDALNVWNKELSATEVTELYNSGNGKQYPN